MGGRRFHSNEVETAVCEWLRMQGPDVYRDGISKLLPRWDECIHVLGVYGEKRYVSGISELHLTL
jgi:hypothetical protein